MKKQIRLHAENDAKRIVFLSLFLLLGIVFGFALAGVMPADECAILQEYVLQRRQSLADGLGRDTAETIWSYFRTPVLLVVLSYCSVAVVPILLLCMAQAFFLSFTVACFTCSLGGEGFLLSLGMLVFRCLFLLPATLYLSGAAIKASFAQEECGRAVFWRCTLYTVGFLFLGIFLELAVSPVLLQYLFAN